MNVETPLVALRTGDYIVMGVYLAGLIVLGLYYRRFAQKDLENYFLAGRKLPGWLNGVSYAATCMNADVAPAYCGMTVICGLFICWWYISRFGLALMIGAILFAVYWRRLSIFTSPEFYEMRFAGKPAMTIRSWVALRSAFIAVVAWTGSGLLGLHKVSHAIIGLEKWETFMLVIPVILVYVTLSGYVGVVISDLIQSLVMIAASILLMFLVLVDFGGPQGLYNALVEQFGTDVVSWHPPSSHELLGLIGVISWTVGTAIGYGGDVAPMAGAMEGQRLMSCRSPREAAKMYMWTEVVLFFMLAILTLPALGAMVKWPGLYDGTINKELSYGMLLSHYMPTGLLGLALIALCASIMSTVDSNMNFGAQVFLNDIYKRSIVKQASMHHYMNVGRVVTVIILALAILVATMAENVIDISVFMLGLSSAELTANWGQWWWWRFNAKARLAASFGGPLIFLLNKYIIFNFIIDAGQSTAYAVVLTSIAMTCIFWIVVALRTKPDPENVLVDFYKRVRPMGWWGPIAEKAGIEPVGWKPIVLGMGLAGLGSVAIGSGVIAFSSFYVARSEVVLVSGIVCVAASVAFKLCYGKYMTSTYGAEPDEEIPVPAAEDPS